MKLWYEKAASTWNEALPIGNGHLGGMIYGTVQKECIQLNDETIWYRGKSDRNNPDSLSHLNEIRNLLLEGDIEKAEELVKLTMFAIPRDQSHYELLGELYIEHVDISNETVQYRRELDLDTAISTVVFEDQKGQTVTREYFTSFTSNLLCCRLSSSQAHGLNVNIRLGRNKRFNDEVSRLNTNTLIMSASAGGRKGVRFKVGCRAEATDGEVAILGETIVVRNATEVSIYLKSVTDYWHDSDEDSVISSFQTLSSLHYENEKNTHIKKYQSQFKRVDFKLGFMEECLTYPTDYLLQNASRYSHYLATLLFHYGRYLLISSSQPNGLPSNLQGIWCDDLNPIWGSKYTININTQMNYWLVGPCDLPEVEYPLFDMLEKMREQGRITAQKMYGARGFTAHHNTDGFGDTAPQSHALGAAIWVLTVPWLCTHIWEHYHYFGDRTILEKHFNLIQEAFLFFEDYLFECNGYLMTGPTVSPENKYRLKNGIEGSVCLSSTIDYQILRYFCDSCIGIARVLDDVSDFTERVTKIRGKLPVTKIGKLGQIQEWFEDYEEVEPGHRHISPLFGLYPYDEIDLEKTPELANAARVTIERRLSHAGFLSSEDREKAIGNWLVSGLHASTQTGWSAAWLIHFFARLRQGDAAYKEIDGLLKNATLGNLFLDHPPFQIDGNLGLVSGICEMLVQSHNNRITLLPALPRDWTEGEVTGFRTRGGYKISFSWVQGKVNYFKIEGGQQDEELMICLADRTCHNNKMLLTFNEDKLIERIF
ncbi:MULTISPECIES: glycoside hydrolase family 95 protein [unclassified Streptococcus]|uniref:glycoside hydrolase family 95 protein n=1 Tax=unclassified Streptococcus TaxID=2608887 RepID=UPI00211B119F|nr:glycoside hydrolase family 95 protein [Streptococcus sp. B01]MCQ9213985.1 glycoside hydrolase family 95 protein [Streptococcus sp. O1]